jgi:hypothetical protein
MISFLFGTSTARAVEKLMPHKQQTINKAESLRPRGLLIHASRRVAVDSAGD